MVKPTAVSKPNKPSGKGASKPVVIKAPSVKIVSPKNKATVARPFVVKCQATGVNHVDVTIARAGMTLMRPTTLSGGFWVVTIKVTDVSPTPAGTWDIIGATGTGPTGSAGALPVQVRIT